MTTARTTSALFETGDGNNSNTARTNTGAMPLNTWTHLAFVVNRAAGSCLIFLDGASVATDTGIENDFSVNSDFEFGRFESDEFHWQGQLDELEIASMLRPAEWIQTAYNNQKTPAMFHVVGEQETR